MGFVVDFVISSALLAVYSCFIVFMLLAEPFANIYRTDSQYVNENQYTHLTLNKKSK